MDKLAFLSSAPSGHAAVPWFIRPHSSESPRSAAHRLRPVRGPGCWQSLRAARFLQNPDCHPSKQGRPQGLWRSKCPQRLRAGVSRVGQLGGIQFLQQVPFPSSIASLSCRTSLGKAGMGRGREGMIKQESSPLPPSLGFSAQSQLSGLCGAMGVLMVWSTMKTCRVHEGLSGRKSHLD